MNEKLILVCSQDISFSNDFGSYMKAGFDITFDLASQEEGEIIAAFLQRNSYAGLLPVRIMVNGTGKIIKEFKND